MDLMYRILWFDDQPNLVQGYQNQIEARLSTFGLRLKVTHIEQFDEETIKPIANQLGNRCPYDLIMVDYDLGEGAGGERLLKRLRNATSSEMVFYSAQQVNALRNKLIAQNVDGIFCLHRTEIGNRVSSIARNALEKVLHPNYMRGLVVGSVSELEYLFGEIIISMADELGHCKEDIANSIAKKEFDHLQQQADELNEKITNGNIAPERKIRNCNLHLKNELLEFLLDEHDSEIAQNTQKTLTSFMDEINPHRIEFAHARTVEQDDVPVFQARNGKIYNSDKMKELVRKIREHKDVTNDLRQLLFNE